MRAGEPWVTLAVEVIEPSRTSSRFEIPAGVTPGVVDLARTDDARLGYIGDWHSHPQDVSLSSTDIKTLERSDQRRRRRHGRAVLVLVRATPEGWQLEAMTARGSGARQLPLLRTGPLSHAD